MREYKFTNKQLVEIDTGILKGCGKVLGVSTTSLPVIGDNYIVELLEDNLDLPNEEYPFSVISVPEIHLTDRVKLPKNK